jgi:transcription elongation factor Elf1
MKCEWCVYRDRKNLEICKNCSLYEGVKPRQDLEKVDIIKMARKLRDKETQEGTQTVKDKIPSLSYCPKCEERSLHFDSMHNQFECLNIRCALCGKPILHGSELFRQIVLKLLNDKRTFRTSYP